jgi:endonuclease/exonuclease/phosphatase (EEP) superfamily protein YafD
MLILWACGGCLSLAEPQEKTSRRQATTTPPSPTTLAGTFRVTSWNMQKGARPGWSDTLTSLMAQSDVLLLQEAYLTEELQTSLQQQPYHWDQARGYLYRDIPGGVLTASAIAPTSVEAMQAREPIIQVPKTMLVTTYPLADSHQVLLAVNVHIVNFTLATVPVQDQLLKLDTILDRHVGPVVIGGDFNTWKQKRIDIMDGWAQKHNLTPVTFADDRRPSFLGHLVDYIFYRGLEVVTATCADMATSDHNPLTVTFKTAGP